jgi:formate dehydrogenase major subunit
VTGSGWRGDQERAQRAAGPRVRDADTVTKSVCPYCAVGCGQNVYVKDGKVIQIEGDSDSPVSRGRLCPKGSASLQLTTGGNRTTIATRVACGAPALLSVTAVPGSSTGY